MFFMLMGSTMLRDLPFHELGRNVRAITGNANKKSRPLFRTDRTIWKIEFETEADNTDIFRRGD